jgi:hypothetical protein
MFSLLGLGSNILNLSRDVPAAVSVKCPVCSDFVRFTDYRFSKVSTVDACDRETVLA